METGSGSDVTVLVVSIAIIPAVFVIFLLCIKIRVSRSDPDIYGKEGTVTRKCEDQLNISNGSHKVLTVPGSEDHNTRTPSYDRKLPELPDHVYRNGSTKEDNTSELYATVDDNVARTLPNEGATALPEVDQSNHPYARVKKKQGKQEHPYAKVGKVGGERLTASGAAQNEEEDEEDEETEYETTDKLTPDTSTAPAATDSNFPLPTTSQGYGHQMTGENRPGIGFPPAHGSNFGAWVPPPARNTSRQSTPLPPEPNSSQPIQQHFSGDSQESTYSTKGYTSISVREPLENLRPQGHHPAQPPIQEGNYVTLSETSDEMYAAIEDTVYMDPMGSAHAANRQQQQRPQEDPNIMYSKIDKSKKRSERPTASYDNGYATVNKVKARLGKKSDAGYESVPYNKLSDQSSARAAPQMPLPGPSTSGRDCTDGAGYKDPEYEVLPGDSKENKNMDGRDPDYETVPSGSQSREPGYETLPSRFRADSFDPGYETLSKRGAGPRSYPQYTSSYNREPGYETVSDVRGRPDPDYESVANNGAVERAGVHINNEGGYFTTGSEGGYETLPDNVTTSLATPHTGGYGSDSQGFLQPASSGRRTVSPATSSVGGRGGRAASPPHSRRMMAAGASEPELHINGITDSTVEYQSIHNYTRVQPVHKLSLDSEEGYETIPDISKSTKPPHHSPPEVGSSGGTRRGAPPPPLPEGSPSPVSSRTAPMLPLAPTSSGPPGGIPEAAPDPGYELIGNHPTSSALNEDLTNSGHEMKSRFDNEEITYIDEESNSCPMTPGSATTSMSLTSASPPLAPSTPALLTPSTPGQPPTNTSFDTPSTSGVPASPTIHMSVVNSGPGVRRASVVMIERVEDQMESLTSFDNHVFV